MPTAYLSPSQLQDLTNVADAAPGSGQNGYPLVWNQSANGGAGQWEASNNIAGITIRAGNGTNSQAIGSDANSTGSSWIAQGYRAGISNNTGSNWIAQGVQAGQVNSGGTSWLAQGANAGRFNSSGSSWIAQGFGAGQTGGGSGWIAQGVNAAQFNVNGSNWMAQGASAARQNTSGFNWIAQGVNAGQSNTGGSNWMAQGVSAGANNTLGSGWISQGYQAGLYDSRSDILNIANRNSKSLICGDFANDCIYFGNVGPITSSANVPIPTAAVHAAASNTTRASLRIDSGVAPTNANTGDIWVNSSNNSLNFELPLIDLQGTQVLATRRTGWTAPTGTATRTTFATFAGQNISATPTEAEVQAIDDHVKVLSERLKALIDDLTTHGLIGT